MTAALRVVLATVFIWTAVFLAPASALAADPVFGEPTASVSLGEPLTVTSQIDGVEGGDVELIVRLVGKEPEIVVPAHPGTVAGGWEATAEIDVPTSIECTCFFDGTSAPNSRIEYQFRVTAADGTETRGPVGQVTVTDDRFEWRTIEQDLVRVHWYEGDDAFAQSAADVSNDAIDQASALLGATLPAPVDLYIYATQQALLEAVSPNRESIAGEAHSTIQTMFVWIAPNDDPEESRIVVAHELTHLVFNENTDNPYHEPPRWLNEGIAVYLSEGYSDYWRSIITFGAQDGTIIPLEGLAGFFPSPQDQFTVAYAQSVSAVDYFVRTYTEETLWDLVRSYADGLSDDDAFTAATGQDLAAFNAAWMASISVEVPEAIGPQPAPAGPVPSSWTPGQPTFAPGSPGASLPPGATPRPGSSPSPRPATPPGDGGSQAGTVVAAVFVGILVIVIVVFLVLFIQRSRNRRLPPQPPQF